MRTAKIYFHSMLCGELNELAPQKSYLFKYIDTYSGPPISQTMPVRQKAYLFENFPPFFDGLLPEGPMLEGLLRQNKIDEHDLFSQLLVVGKELVGAITVEEAT